MNGRSKLESLEHLGKCVVSLALVGRRQYFKRFMVASAPRRWVRVWHRDRDGHIHSQKQSA